MEIPFDTIESYDNNKEWVVLIHGFGGSRRMFKKQIEKFKEYFNILVLDLPGHGESSSGITSSENINRTLNDIARNILDTIHDLGINKANFVGISLGTLIVTSIIMLEPQIVNKVVFGGAVLGINCMLKIFIQFINSIKHLLPYTLTVRVFAHIMMPRNNHKISRAFMVKESNNLDRKEFIGWFELVIKNISFIRNNIEEVSKQRGLFIMGDQDYVFRTMVKKVTNDYKLKLGIINKCGHVCNIDKADEFNKMALDYLSKQ